MTLKKEKIKRDIKPQNYVYSVLILVFGILLTLYVFKWYQVRKEERLLTSYLIKSNTVESSISDLDTLKQVMQESPTKYFIYISYTGNEEIYKLEKGLKSIIDKYKINDAFYFVDLTDFIKNNDDYLELIKKELEIDDIDELPIIIYVNNDEVINSNVFEGEYTNKKRIKKFENLLKNNGFNIIK